MIIGIDGNEANIKNRVGVNQYAAGLLNALEGLQEAKGHEFVIYLKEPPLPHLPASRVGWTYKVLGGGGLWVVRKLMPHLWLTRPQPNIFFTPSHYGPFLFIPTVVSVMDLGYLRFPEQFRKYDLYQLKYWGFLSMKIAKKIIAISESTKVETIENYPWTHGKVEVAYPGYDVEKFKVENSKSKIKETKEKYRITGDYILFLSTLKPSKNVEGLLEAFQILLEKKSSEAREVKLVIAGKKGWLYESIFDKVKLLGLENLVIFTDFVEEAEKPALVAGARALISPSFWEGFGMHVLEAMATGVPVVASNTGSLPEIVEDAGVLVNPKDPKSIAQGIEKVLENHGKFSKAGIIQAKKFSWENTARQTLAILEDTAK